MVSKAEILEVLKRNAVMMIGVLGGEVSPVIRGAAVLTPIAAARIAVLSTAWYKVRLFGEKKREDMWQVNEHDGR